MSEPQFTVEFGKQRHYTRVFGRWWVRDWLIHVAIAAAYVAIIAGTIALTIWAHG